MKEGGGQWGFILTPPSQKNLFSKTPALSGSKQYHNHKHNLLHDLKNCLLRKKSPSKNNDYSFTKLFQPGNMKTTTKMSLPSLELTILIFNFLSTKLENASKTQRIDNFKKHLMTKNTPQDMKTKEIRKYSSTSKV